MRTIYLAIFALCLALCTPTFSEDIELEISQTVLEKFLLALAPIKGSGDYKSPGGNIPYQWEIQNPKITLANGQALFTADTSVGIGNAKYKTVAKGKGSTSYDPVTNKLGFQITQASFSLSFSFFGNTLHLADIDITKKLSQKFEMDMSSKVNQIIKIRAFSKNEQARYVRMYSVDPTIKIEDKKIKVYSNVAVVPTDPPKNLPDTSADDT